MTRRRSSWGNVRRLASGRFQARYRVAGAEHPKERPIASIEQVYALAEAIEPRYLSRR
jgi:hypothetical protein